MTSSINDRRVLTAGTLEALLAEVQDLVLDGWVISDDERGELSVFGSNCQVTMCRNDATVQAFKDKATSIQGRPKLTPAERMAKARDARGANQKPKLDVGTVLREK